MCQNRAVNLSISNLFGQIVLSEKGANANRAPHRLDVSRLESGMYYIRVEAAGMRAVVRKLQLVN